MPKSSVHIEFDGLGTRWWVEILDADVFPAAIATLVTDTTKLFDDTYSRFKASSLVGQLNEHKRLVRPPKELLDMFEFAKKMHSATDGAFDISVGGTLQRLGYGDTGTASRVYPDFWNEVKLNRDEIVIPGESAVDFGGFGKGWLLDKLAVLLEQNGCPQYLINGGGDIVLSSTEPIELGLEHPYDSEKVIGTTKITRGALAVSSTVKRRWNVGGNTHHHIIDPLQDSSSDSPVISVYVRGQTSLITDTLATVVLIRPEMVGRLKKQFGIEVIIVRKDQLETS